MGTGCSKVKKIERGNQTAWGPEPIPAVKSTVSIPSKSQEPVFVREQKPTNRQQGSIQGDWFDVDDNVEDYTTVWDNDTKLVSTFQRAIKNDTKKLEHYQEEKYSNKWNKQNSTAYDTAHIDSTVDRKTNSTIYLTSSDQIDELINNLNHTHKQLDDIIKRRTNQISNETELVLSHILEETQQKQQRLLAGAKELQSQNDEKYRKQLQEHIIHLDAEKAKDLGLLQIKLQNYRDEILQESHSKIMRVNEQANIIKAKILEEEQYQTAEKIDSIVSQIQKISMDDKYQQLGTEVMTETHIKTNANVGSKPPGRIATNQPEERSKNNKKIIE